MPRTPPPSVESNVPAVLVDASALVALLDRDDAEHARCVEALKRIRQPLATVWPALAEAMHLLADSAPGPDALCDMVHDSVLQLIDLQPRDVARVKLLMQKYSDLPVDFTDAALVCAAGRDGVTRIVSFDRHFEVYRLPGRKRFTVLPGRRTRP